ncbi:hypothetical protein TPAU25S_01479 [Tsukamurella paurometabola]|uniref:DUF418 domain-containing protein n=1 Tax=Tsukamurella paurometabola (strain ATCC 8368 / DSM 20162 / CCUG 35730 / CIP 100753 / JCM 10117 / KCTC 9821 / NBRC 16120 / NCIMB 702349 / NCTC 13040) TaxID=521096 RepID=D5UVG1_TSUPD|nr:DUF418 domain-containing protein [Tsukamurella paurometabola]ADG77751.1 protein of unknown function DUF405 [Tsukamurella paurometabola DSM 20162]SUP28619.1 Predicted membrane protein [Tsukamurella paurometabola]
MTTTTAPTASSRRIASLDVARGIAILGTLGTNIWIFTEPSGMVGYIDSVGTESLPIRILQTLAQGKFLGLLSLMFGVGLAIQQASAARHDRPWPGRYWRRALVLLLDGLVHFLLVAEFDVLMGYALVSFLVSALLILQPRARTRWVVGAIAVHLAVVTLAVVAMMLPGSADGSGAGRRQGVNPYADGSFWDLVLFRADHALVFRAETIFMIPLTIAMFLTGARLFQSGLFAPDGAALRRRLMLLGAFAAPVDLAFGVFGAPLGLAGPAVFVGRYVIAPIVALGLLALIAEFYQRRGTGRAGRAMGRIGTTALSCYVLQNIIASVICYGWGFGLAARYGGEHRLLLTVLVFFAVVACLLVASTLWTRRFPRGPIEMMMHRVA